MGTREYKEHVIKNKPFTGGEGRFWGRNGNPSTKRKWEQEDL